MIRYIDGGGVDMKWTGSCKQILVKEDDRSDRQLVPQEIIPDNETSYGD